MRAAQAEGEEEAIARKPLDVQGCGERAWEENGRVRHEKVGWSTGAG